MESKRMVEMIMENDDGVRVKYHLPPESARTLAKMFVAEADEIEGVVPRKIALRKRWEPGGNRDMSLFWAAALLGISVGWLNEAVAGREVTKSVIWVVVCVVTATAMLVRRYMVDRNDIAEEDRESYHGDSVNEATGRLPWR